MIVEWLQNRRASVEAVTRPLLWMGVFAFVLTFGLVAASILHSNLHPNPGEFWALNIPMSIVLLGSVYSGAPIISGVAAMIRCMLDRRRALTTIAAIATGAVISAYILRNSASFAGFFGGWFFALVAHAIAARRDGRREDTLTWTSA